MQDKTLAPALVLRAIDEERLGIRFINIGRRHRFNALLQRGGVGNAGLEDGFSSD